jgi:sulfite reductase (NADPH) flavoprotein alpha-component
MNPPWLELSIPRVIIGGEPGQCTVVVYDPLASRQHASLDFSNGMWVLTDLYSANGTYVNGARIGRHVLRPGDCILIGRTELLFH